MFHSIKEWIDQIAVLVNRVGAKKSTAAQAPSVRSIDYEWPQVWRSADTRVDEWQITTHGGAACRSIIMSNMKVILQPLTLILAGSRQKQIVPATKLLVNPN